MVDDLRVRITGDDSGLRAAIESASGNLRSLDAVVSRTGQTMGLIWSAAGQLLAAGLAVDKVKDFGAAIVQAGQQTEQLVARIGLITGAGAAARDQLDALYAVSKQTGTGIAATADVFQRLGQQAGALGATDREITRVVRTVQELGRVSGTSAQELSGTLVQLAQGLASGRLQGDELRSILESMPVLAKAIADGLDVTVGQLREMGAQGQLTGDKVFKAIIDAGKKADAQFAALPRTVDQATAAMADSWQRLLATLDQKTGTSRFVTRIIDAADALINKAAEVARTGELSTPQDRLASGLRQQNELAARRAASEQIVAGGLSLWADRSQLSGYIEALDFLNGYDRKLQALEQRLDQVRQKSTLANNELLTAARNADRRELEQGPARAAEKAANDQKLALAELAKAAGLVVDKGRLVTQTEVELTRETSAVNAALAAGAPNAEGYAAALDRLKRSADPLASALKGIVDQTALLAYPEGAPRDTAAAVQQVNQQRAIQNQPPLDGGGESVLRSAFQARETAQVEAEIAATATLLGLEKQIIAARAGNRPTDVARLEAQKTVVELTARGVAPTVAAAKASQDQALALAEVGAQAGAAAAALLRNADAQLRLAQVAGLGEAAQRRAEQDNKVTEAAASGTLSPAAQTLANQRAEVAARTRLWNESSREAERQIAANDRLTAAWGRGALAAQDATLADQARSLALKEVTADSAEFAVVYQRYLDLLSRQDQSGASVKGAEILANQRDEIELLKLDSDLVGAIGRDRELEVAVLRERQALLRQGIDADSAQGAQIIANTRQIAEQTKRVEQQQRAWDDLTGTARDGFAEVGEGLRIALKGGEDGAKSLGETLISVLDKFENKLWQLAVTNPLENALFGGNSPTLSSLGGAGGGLLGSLFSGGEAARPSADFIGPMPESGGWLSGLGDVFSSIFHDGGIVGQSAAPSRRVSPWLFANAYRYHGGGTVGLQPGEVPIIALAGERVVPAGQSGTAGPITVQIIDQRGSGAPVDVSQSTNASGERVLKIMIRDEVAHWIGSGAADKTMGAAYGLRRQGISR